MSRLFFFLISAIFVSAVAFIVFDKDYPGAQLPAQYVANVDNGETVLYASGCRSCHLSTNPNSPNELGGGEAFKTNFGTFYAPNISASSTYGIGSWAFEDFYVAMKHGQNPTGSNYFPVFHCLPSNNLGVSVKTAATYRQRAYQKLGISSKGALFALCRQV